MQFWRIDRLRSRLVNGPLPAGEVFLYFLGWVWLPFLTNSLQQSPNGSAGMPGAWSDYWLISAIHFTGLCWAFKSNDGVCGKQFLERIFSIGWVVSIRLFAVSFFVGVAVGVSGLVANADIQFLISASSVLFVCIWYQRVASNIRQVAAICRATSE